MQHARGFVGPRPWPLPPRHGRWPATMRGTPVAEKIGPSRQSRKIVHDDAACRIGDHLVEHLEGALRAFADDVVERGDLDRRDLVAPLGSECLLQAQRLGNDSRCTAIGARAAEAYLVAPEASETVPAWSARIEGASHERHRQPGQRLGTARHQFCLRAAGIADGRARQRIGQDQISMLLALGLHQHRRKLGVLGGGNHAQAFDEAPAAQRLALVKPGDVDTRRAVAPVRLSRCRRPYRRPRATRDGCAASFPSAPDRRRGCDSSGRWSSERPTSRPSCRRKRALALPPRTSSAHRHWPRAIWRRAPRPAAG